ncbi:hypothetical protein G9A89_022373 [Geosiphon pyriformis]|nr:hypothetical protein G9A89_022373 [Geosiphon pyriformis]
MRECNEVGVYFHVLPLQDLAFSGIENLAIFPASEYSKIADLVKNHLVRNQKTPEDLFNYLENKSSKRSIDHILLGFSLEHGIGTIPNLKKAFLEFQEAANAKDSFGQFFLRNCYDNGIGTSQDQKKAFELYSKAAEAGNTNAQYNLALCYDKGEGTTKNLEKAFELYSKAAKAVYTIAQISLRKYCLNGLQTIKDMEKVENPSPQTNIEMYYRNGWGIAKSLEEKFEFYLKAKKHLKSIRKQQTNYSSYRNDFPDLNALYLTLHDQNDLERNSKGDFLDFEAFFDHLSDEFKCLKFGNLGIIITGSPISHEKIHFGVTLVKNHDYQPFGEHGIAEMKILIKWISPNEMKFLEKVGTGGFGIVKEGIWERGKILFWDEKNQKYKRSGATRVALKCRKYSQNIEYVNSVEFIAHLNCASCKYILQCYGITKDVTTNEFVMVLPFAEHGNLRAFLKMNEITLTWEMVLRVLLQIATGLRFIHDLNLVLGDLHPGNILVLRSNPLKVAIADLGLCRPANYSPQPGEIFGVVRYLAPEICNLSPHTKYSDIYSCAIISWEIISGERPWNGIKDPICIQFYTIQGRRLPIQKHTPQCIQEMIEKNWEDKPHCRDSAEELQKRVIAARDDCNLNEFISRKRLNYKTIQVANHDKSQKILSPTISQNEANLAFGS